jgi:hypothetical protein
VKQGCDGTVVDEGVVELTLLEETSVANVVDIIEDELEGSMENVLGTTSEDVATSEAGEEVLDTISDEILAPMSELATLETSDIVLETMSIEELGVGSGMLMTTSGELRVGSELTGSTSEDVVLD